MEWWLVRRDVRGASRFPKRVFPADLPIHETSTSPRAQLSQPTTTFFTMDRSELETRANELRQELKAWEKSFALQNEGRKAGRDDIKANASICECETLFLNDYSAYEISNEV